MLLSSCGTRRQLPTGSTASPTELSHKFGVKVTQKDNLALYAEINHWLGTPYRMGGNTKKGTDCSGFTGQVYKQVYGKNINRSTADILKNNCRKVGRSNLQEGDLVFFHTSGKKKKTASHVGIYLKNGKFAHASTSKGVIVSSLSEPYYQRTWLTGGRVK